MRPPLLVPWNAEVEDVLARMRRLNTHLAVVLDKYNGTAGLVTMEDLLEEIVGPIYDEHDRPEPASAGSAGGVEHVASAAIGAPGETIVDGAMPISEFNVEYNVSLDDDDYTTLGGLLFGRLGRVPHPGDVIEEAGFVFGIVSMAERRVERVRVFRAPAAAADAKRRADGAADGQPSGDGARAG
jgi:CBS domain containing-hemolysin-like protein